MVSRKNQGFQVSESRQNRVRLNVSNWMMMGALNGRSEIGANGTAVVNVAEEGFWKRTLTALTV